MYLNYISHLKQVIPKSAKQNYSFRCLFHWCRNYKQHFSRSLTPALAGKISSEGCESKLTVVDSPIYFILLSIAGGTVRNENETLWDSEKVIKEKIQDAKSAIEEGHIFKAMAILEQTISLYDNPERILAGMSSVYEMLATVVYQNGEIERAQALLMTITDKMLRSGIGTLDSTVTNFILKIARLYDELEKDDLAELGYKNCIALQKYRYMNGQDDDETVLTWINALYWYGKFLESRKRFMEAKQCFDSSYALCVKVKTILSSQIMVILYDLGEMASATGDLESAKKYYTDAIFLGRDINSKDLPKYYVKLGLTNLYKGLNEQAYIWCDLGRAEARRKNNIYMENEAIKCLQQLKIG